MVLYTFLLEHYEYPQIEKAIHHIYRISSSLLERCSYLYDHYDLLQKTILSQGDQRSLPLCASSIIHSFLYAHLLVQKIYLCILLQSPYYPTNRFNGSSGSALHCCPPCYVRHHRSSQLLAIFFIFFC